MNGCSLAICPASFVAAALAAPSLSDQASTGDGQAGAIPTLAQIELAHIRRVLEVYGGNRTVAAQHLGITRQTLAKKIGSADET